MLRLCEESQCQIVYQNLALKIKMLALSEIFDVIKKKSLEKERKQT